MGKKKEVKGFATSSKDIEPALWKCIKTGDVHEFKELIDTATGETVNVNARNPKTGDTFLTAAINSSETGIVDLLLAKGADPNLASEKGKKETPLTASCWALDDMCVINLLKKKADPTKANVDGKTPLHIAAINGAKEIFMLLLTGVEDSSMYDDAEELYKTMETQKDEILSNADDEFAALTHPDVIRSLDAQCHDGATPLHYLFGEIGSGPGYDLLAVWVVSLLAHLASKSKERRQEVKQLLGRVTRAGRNVLHYFMMSGSTSPTAANLLTALLNLDAQPFAFDKEGNNALLTCCGHHESPRLMQILIDHHVNLFTVKVPLQVNVIDKSTVLHAAAEVGSYTILEVLLAACLKLKMVDLHAEDVNGVTALVMALENDQRQCVGLLVKYGAPESVVKKFVEEKEKQEALEDEEEEEAGDFSGQGCNGGASSCCAKAGPPAKRGKRPPGAGTNSNNLPKKDSKKGDDGEKKDGAEGEQKEEEGPSWAAVIIFVLMVSGMILPYLDSILGGGGGRKAKSS